MRKYFSLIIASVMLMALAVAGNSANSKKKATAAKTAKTTKGKSTTSNEEKAASFGGEQKNLIYSLIVETDTSFSVKTSGNANSDVRGVINIPEERLYNGNKYLVTTIGDFTSKGITQINLHGYVTDIKWDAFWHCPNLTKINMTDDSETFCSVEGVLYQFRESRDVEWKYPYINEKDDDDDNDVKLVSTQDDMRTEHYVLVCCPRNYSGFYEIPDEINGLRVTGIGPKAFKDCKNITGIKLSRHITEISNECFKGCTKLKNISGECNIKDVKIAAFKNCTSLKNIDFLNKKTKINIGKQAFKNCKGLTSINLNKTQGLKIAEQAFDGCSELKWAIFGTGKVECGNSAVLNNCSKLTYAVGQFANKSAFKACNKAVVLNLTDNQAQLLYVGKDVNTLTLPNVIAVCGRKYNFEGSFGKKDKDLNGNVFESDKKFSALTTLDVPMNVAKIEAGSFATCPKLKEARVYNHTTIESGAFSPKVKITRYDDSFDYTAYANKDKRYTEFKNKPAKNPKDPNLKYLKFESVGNDPTKLALNCGCEEDEDVSKILDLGNYKPVGKELTVIKKLSNCRQTDTIYIPASVNKIEENAFEGCESLQSLEIDEDNDTYAGYKGGIYKKLDNGTLELVDIVPQKQDLYIPDSINGMPVASIKKGAFINKKYISTLRIGGSLKAIEDSAFFGCQSLKKVITYHEMEEIGKSAFEGCSNLNSININGKNIVIAERAFSDDRNLQTVQMGDSIESMEIRAEAFKGCSSLKRIDLHTAHHSSIGDYAFSGCTSLKKVLFASNTDTIGKYGFSNCEQLQTIYLPSGKSEMHISENAFNNCQKLKGFDASNATAVTINANAFNHGKTLKNLQLPENVKINGSPCFYDCGVERYVYGIDDQQEMFADCNQLVEYRVYKNANNKEYIRVKSIGSDVVNLEIPDSIPYLGTWYKVDAMDSITGEHKLESLKLPMYLKVLEKGTLTDCKNLKTLKIHRYTDVRRHSYSKAKAERYGTKDEKKEMKKADKMELKGETPKAEEQKSEEGNPDTQAAEPAKE